MWGMGRENGVLVDTEDCPLPRTDNQILTYKSRVEPREKSQTAPRWTERPFVRLTGTSISVGYAVTVHCEVMDFVSLKLV